MNIIKPKIIQKGDTIGLLSVSGSLDKNHLKALDIAKDYFTAKGYKVKISPNTYISDMYFAGNDTERKDALEKFFLDEEIKAIITTRGGWGCLRFADSIDYNLIAENPKIFVGYSDITTLLWLIYRTTGLITFHGAMACSHFGKNLLQLTEKSFWDAISFKMHSVRLRPTMKLYTGKKITGKLFPANLSTLVSLCNQQFYTDEDMILLIEDINEPVYKIDRMLTQLFYEQKFKKNVKCVILGDFANIDNEILFQKLFEHFYYKYDIPVLNGLQFGHTESTLTIPLGVMAQVDIINNKILIDI